MPHLDNPAGRLEALLTALKEEVNNDSNGPYIDCWGRVMGLPAPKVVLALADVLRLIEQIRDDVARAGGSGYARLVARHIELWKGLVVPMGIGLGASSNSLSMPSSESLEDLAVVSDFLHEKLPDGKTPSVRNSAGPPTGFHLGGAVGR